MKRIAAYRKYFVYLDDGEYCCRVAIAAESEEAAKEWCRGNGEIIAVKDVTDRYPIDESAVRTALHQAGFGENERDFICRALVQIGIAE